MRLSLHTDYGLRVLMYLAGEAERGKVAEIAEFFDISRDHVAKVVQTLSRLGFVRSVRGIGGGVELARDPSKITIGDVISQLQGGMHLLDCVVAEENICVIQPRCRLKGVLAKAEQIQMDYLNSVRLSDVATPGKTLVSLKV